jgi:hypothetical protein
VRWWLNPDGVSQEYPSKSLEELANFGNFMALFAGLSLAECGSNASAFNALQDLLPINTQSNA